TPTVPLSEGVHTAYVKIVDNAGNYAEATWSFTVDITPPYFTVESPKGENNPYGTKGILFKINVIGENASKIQYSVNGGGFYNLCTSCSYYSKTRYLYEGNNSIKIRVYDKAGNMAEQQMLIKVDSEAPRILSVSPGGGSRIKGLTTFSVKYTEAILTSAEIVSWTSNNPVPYKEPLSDDCPSGSYVSCSINKPVSLITDGKKFYYYFELIDSQGKITKTPTYTTTITA
ncbi:MAG: hypothetical protein NTV63_01320, partial [Candidatus Woesearchaeota archaeon]|nr:hypothetical protein [Candidatus Woesearchaeota archaeon]